MSWEKYHLKADEELIRQMQSGGEEAFVELYRRHQSDLFRFAWHMTGSAHTAEEVVQETFLTLFRRHGNWRADRGTVRGFLFGIARNHVLRQIENGREFDDLIGDVPLDSDLLGDLTRAERAAAVKEAVLTLPAGYREVAVLCDMEEVSYEDAARIIGCPVGTVRSRLNRARQLLTAKLKAKFVEKLT